VPVHQLVRRSVPTVVVALALVGALSACSTPATSPPTSSGIPSTVPSSFPTEVSPPGDVPDTQAYVVFTSADHTYSIKVPEGWAQSTKAGVTTFTDKLNSIAIASSASAAAPTVPSVRSATVPNIAASVPKFALGTIAAFKRPGGSGVMVTYLDDSPPSAVTGSVVRNAVELFVFWKNGKRVSVTLTSPQGADNVDPWNIVTRSFAWLG
jgi:hypothetical protein